MINYLGCHALLDGIAEVIPYYNCFQVCLSSPIAFQYDEVKIEENISRLVKAYPNKLFIGHSPYWYNLLIENRFLKYSKKHMYAMIRILAKHGVMHYVFHPGYRGIKGSSEFPARVIPQADSAPFFTEMLQHMVPSIPGGFKILAENTPLSKLDTKGLSLDNMIKAIKDVGSDRVGFCLDTQHAYCSGEDPDRFMEFAQFADVIHLNPNPPGLAHGCRRDRHSETALYESEGLPYTLLKQMINEFPEKIKIIEADPDVAVKDAKFLVTEGILSESVLTK